MLERSCPLPNEEIVTRAEESRAGLGMGRGPVAPGPRRLGGLVLTRRLDQAIVVGGDLEILVADLKPNAVRLRLTAPRSIPIHRKEVYETIRSGGRPGASEIQASPTALEGRGSLVLTRHVGEKVMIGDSVEVEVAEIRSGAVRLRVHAPREIAVHRREIHDAIQQSGEDRAGLPGDSGS